MNKITLPSGRTVPVTGYIYRFLYHIPTGEYRQWVKPFYVSRNGKICSEIEAQFEGMNKEKLGQFLNRPGYFEMFSTKENYHKNKALFMASVLKRLKKIGHFA